MAARHFKYAYEAHLSPKKIFSKMILVNEPLINGIDLTSEKNKIYFSRRKQIKNLMKQINSYIDFNSQTYFLMLYYMDLIFTHKDLEKIFYSHFSLWYQYPIYNDLQMSNYILLSLACLVIASKFNENDPCVPSMSSYLRLLYYFSKKKYIFSLDNLFLAEVVVLKILKYKLNYYTIYHYLIFFFTHGIVLEKTIERSRIYKKISERKILEKVYIKVREIFDEIIESEKYYEYYIGQKNYEIVVLILLWCTEHILGEEIKDNENIFKLIFGINIEPNKKQEIYKIIEEIHTKIKKRNALNKSTRLIELSNNKKINSNMSNQKSNLYSSQMKSINQDYNYSNNYSIHQKSSITSSTIYSSNLNPYSLYLIGDPHKINNDYFNQFDNRSIQKETMNNNNKNNYNYNYSIESSVPLNNNKLNGQLNQTNISNIKYGPNKRIYLTTTKENATNSIFSVNSIDKMDLKNKSDGILANYNKIDMNKRYNSSREVKVLPFQIEKTPSDNKRQLNENRRKIILINNYNNEPKMRKKSLSCSKDIVENNNEYYHPRQKTNLSNINNINNTMKIEEKIKSTTITNPSNSIKLNNHFFTYKKNPQKTEKKDLIEKPTNKIEKDKNKISEYKKYLLNRNLYHKNSLNSSYMINNGNTEKKIIKDNIVNRTKYFDRNSINLNNNIREYNANIELGPQDNYTRRSINKSYLSNINKSIDIDNTYNKANTIIINNNIHINTLINDKSKNIYLANKDIIGDNKSSYENKFKNKK